MFHHLINSQLWAGGKGVGGFQGCRSLGQGNHQREKMPSPGVDSGSAFLWLDFILMLVANSSTNFRVSQSQCC